MVEKKTTKKASTAAKKTKTTKKAKKADPNAVNDEKPLTKKETEYYRNLLWERRCELLGDVDHMRIGALENSRQDSSGELSSMPIHMADVGTDNYEQEFTLGLIESERKVLKEIDRALVKIKEGNYGRCEVSDRIIGRARLEAKPEARFHIDIARQIEKGLIAAPDDNKNGYSEEE